MLTHTTGAEDCRKEVPQDLLVPLAPALLHNDEQANVAGGCDVMIRGRI